MSKKLFLKGVSYSYIRQIITLITGIISLPLLLNYFGTVNYGIWILIVGLAGYINTISFGIPSAMTTLIAKTSNQNEKYQILKKSFYLLGVISFVFLAFFIFVLYFNDTWIISLLGNIDEEFIPLTKNMFILFVIFTLIKLPLNLYMQFFTGMNTVYISEIYQIATAIVGFITVLVVVYLDLGILIFVLLWLVGQIIVNIISVFHVFVKYNYLNKEVKSLQCVTYNDILKSGFAFFQVGIAASLVWSTDNLVISHFLSPELVTPYSIAFKIFTYIFMFSAIINGVIGPMYGNAYANNDWDSIRKFTSVIHKLLPIVGAFVWIFLIFFAKEIIILWTGKEEAFGGYLLIFSLGLYGYALSYVNTYATLVYSLNFANKTLYIAWGEAIVNLLLSIIFIQFLGIGGVALGTALSALFISMILPNVIKKITKDEVIYDFKYTRHHFLLLVLPLIILSLYIINLNIINKIIIFLLISIIYLFFSWKLLGIDDRNILINIIRRKNN
ncbi:MAG: oligosaccharide flippase family protein [Arcobacter sp.]|uniref:oligosaccharide flippase family protein n=1 Tax=Arcobacter sp. TaxID=1872629 RepID=UPI00258D978F|nr:oligosaccharide flippase family protein [Arcobacter sp.]MDD3008363.1 oligosaccharide flippase family protein [Arcobacter sp.]